MAVLAAACSSTSNTPTLVCGAGTKQVGTECLPTGTGGGTTTTSTTTSGTTSTTSSTTSTTSATGTGGSDGGATFTETALTLELAFTPGVVPDGGTADGGPPPPKLVITARDGSTPVVTDLWLYTLDAQGNKTPLTGFTSTQARKSPRLMLPATISGQPSGLSPANDGNANGTMTCACGSRGTLDQGAFVSAVTGTVTVTLPATPTTPILVVAGVEDQRYGGAAVIDVDGTAGTVPAGALVLETHTRVSFTNDVAPILQTNCGACHVAGAAPSSDAGIGVGPGYNANWYVVTGSANDLVNGNFGVNEQTYDCQVAHPDGGAALDACIQGITAAQFLVEPGAPAASDLLQRSRPDESSGASTEGLLWFGSKGQRYSTKYGDRRMPSTTTSTDAGDWTNQPCYFDTTPADFQVLFNWIAQGAIAN